LHSTFQVFLIMKVKRQKGVQRHLKFYSNNFGFHAPYQVLVDGTFCHQALKQKVNIVEQLQNYLGHGLKILTTPCIVSETERFGSLLFGTALIAKQFPVHNCGHKKCVDGATCLKEMLQDGNPSHYILATQDPVLQEHARNHARIPLLFLHRNAPTLEAPSMADVQLSQELSSAKLHPSMSQLSTLRTLKREKLGLVQERRKKPRKRGGPNPLSCKLSKKSNIDLNEKRQVSVRKKQRKRIKIPKHRVFFGIEVAEEVDAGNDDNNA
ncbi:unnamed protein product, partial [Darwinula stevensoni]